jgi:hypothetical protein
MNKKLIYMAFWLITFKRNLQGRMQDFKLGGDALKKIAPSRGRREHFWGISCEKSRFYAKKSFFSNFRPPPWSVHIMSYSYFRLLIDKLTSISCRLQYRIHINSDSRTTCVYIHIARGNPITTKEDTRARLHTGEISSLSD